MITFVMRDKSTASPPKERKHVFHAKHVNIEAEARLVMYTYSPWGYPYRDSTVHMSISSVYGHGGQKRECAKGKIEDAKAESQRWL